MSARTGLARATQRGFTLVELMVSLVMFSFVAIGLLAVAVSIANTYREQRDSSAAESLVRVPADFIADVLRQASPGVSSFAIADAATCSTSALSVTNSTTGPDSLDVIYASGGVATATTSVLLASTTTVTVADATGLAAGDSVVITNLAQGHFYKLQAVAGNTLTLQLGCVSYAPPAGGYAAGSMVVRAQHAVFSIALLDGQNALWFDPDAGDALAAEPFSEGMEDMQIAVGIDTSANGLTETGVAGDDDEWSYNVAGDTAIATWPPVAGSIRAVRFTLVARAANPDTANALLYLRPAAEDRAAAGANDNYRRRTLRSTIEFRNVGVSP